MTASSPVPAFVVVARGDTCKAVLADPDWVCPVCRGRGGEISLDDRGYEVFRPCACKRALGRAELFDRAQIGRRFAGSTFSAYVPKSPGQNRALQQVQDFVLMYPQVKRGLLLWGPVGTGKTHLIVSMFRQLTLEKGVPCAFVDFGHLLNDIKRTFRGEQSEAELMVPLVQVELLLVDELGKGRVTDWEMGVLDDLISRRYNAGRTTLFTTNFDPTEPRGAATPSVNPAYEQRRAQGAGDSMKSLLERVDLRIYSRLCEMCEFVEVGGRDHRRQGRT